MSAPTPPAQTLASVLGHSETLTGLLRRMRDSQARLADVAPQLPAGLKGQVRAGPLDDAAWVLLVSHAAAAAKLRQMLPMLESALQQRGWPPVPIRIKVLPKGGT